MSYQEQSDNYRSGPIRSRAEMCAREQAGIFVNDGRPDIAALGKAIVGGSFVDIDAIIASVCTGPNWDTLEADPDLLSAVQAAWPTVAAALHPQT